MSSRKRNAFRRTNWGAYQEQLLEPLFLHARQHVPFYAQRLVPVFPGGKLDLSRFDEIPILTRAQAQANVKTLAALDLPPHVGPVETEETSGSTGRPFVHRRNGLVTIANLALTDRVLRWWDFDGAKTMATFISRHPERAPPPNGATMTGWRTGFSGKHHIIDMWADTDVQIDWLSGAQATLSHGLFVDPSGSGRAGAEAGNFSTF